MLCEIVISKEIKREISIQRRRRTNLHISQPGIV
jgi:hypothetical protein